MADEEKKQYTGYGYHGGGINAGLSGNKKAVFVTNGDSSHSQQARADRKKTVIFL